MHALCLNNKYFKIDLYYVITSLQYSTKLNYMLYNNYLSQYRILEFDYHNICALFVDKKNQFIRELFEYLFI